MEKKIQYTVSIYTENNVGLLNRISAIFLKRHINIESFTTSECEIENVFRFIIVVEMTESGIEKVIKQIEKQVDAINGEIAAYNKIEPPVTEVEPTPTPEPVE